MVGQPNHMRLWRLGKVEHRSHGLRITPSGSKYSSSQFQNRAEYIDCKMLRKKKKHFHFNHLVLLHSRHPEYRPHPQGTYYLVWDLHINMYIRNDIQLAFICLPHTRHSSKFITCHI